MWVILHRVGSLFVSWYCFVPSLIKKDFSPFTTHIQVHPTSLTSQELAQQSSRLGVEITEQLTGGNYIKICVSFVLQFHGELKQMLSGKWHWRTFGQTRHRLHRRNRFALQSSRLTVARWRPPKLTSDTETRWGEHIFFRVHVDHLLGDSALHLIEDDGVLHVQVGQHKQLQIQKHKSK